MRKIFTLVVAVFGLCSFTHAQNYSWVLKQSGGSLGGPIDVLMTNTNVVYFGADNKVYKSTDRGETFTQAGINVPGASDIKCVLLNDDIPGTFLVAVESSPNDKVYKTTNDGQTWTLTLDEGQMSFFGIPMTQDPSHPDTIYTMTGVNFKRSTDFGNTWATISSNFGPVNAPCDIEVFPDTSIILIGDNGTGIFRSTNYGQTWAQTFFTSGEIPTVSVDYQNPGIAWATKWSGGGGMLKSTNYGQSWTTVSYFGSINMWGVHIQPTDGNIILANSYSTSPGSWRSTDAGATWNPINIPSSGYQVFSVDSMTQFAAQSSGFYKLQSPYFIPVELESFTANLVDEKVVLQWTTATELNNMGFEIERSLDHSNFEKIGFVPGYGTTTERKSYSYTIESVPSQTQFYRLKQIDFDGTFTHTSSVEVEGVMPVEFSLNQNFPNPFNPSTRITFSIPVEANVTLKIFNMIGQEIITLVNQKYSAGTQEIIFNANSISSGNYFYSIEAIGVDGKVYSSTKKMTLIK